MVVKIIGAGLAGCEAALTLSALGVKCKLLDAKPKAMSAAHKSGDFAELVCSNSLKSNDFATAGGLIKQELRLLKSPLIEVADRCAVPAGGALAVDRVYFSRSITDMVMCDKNIEFVPCLVDSFDDSPTIIATGPLTLPPLLEFLEQKLGACLHFFDAAAPIVSEESIEFSSAFVSDRYGKSGVNRERNNEIGGNRSRDKGGDCHIFYQDSKDIRALSNGLNMDCCDGVLATTAQGSEYFTCGNSDEVVGNESKLGEKKAQGAYVNCPMNKEEYDHFVTELVKAKTAIMREFEKGDIFEGCMPVEVMARRGHDSLRFGPLKPVGLYDKNGKRPYAVVQLRRENAAGSMYNLVGFQTNLKFGEQQRVFSLIPALKNAEFLRFGVMHRNSFINSPLILNSDFSLKNSPLTFIAGQLSGVEGYCESIASGHIAAISMWQKLKGGTELALPMDTMCGVLSRYISTENQNFQPMNANFGLLPPPEKPIRDKQLKKTAISNRSLASMQRFVKDLGI